MKKIYLACLLATVLSACGDKATDAVSLSGEIKGLGNDTIYLYGADRLYSRMDTLVVTADKFSATLSTDTLVAVWLQFSDGTEYPLYMDKGDEIRVKGAAAALSALDVAGNVHNDELTAFMKELYGLATPSDKVLEEKAEAFINSHHSSLGSIYLLEKYFVQKPAPDYARIRSLTERMTGELKDRPYVEELLNRMQEEEKVAVGKTAPYFQLPDVKGKKISRSDFRNRYLLMHFWASWDAQSRAANDSLRQIYKKERKNKDFALLGVSLDIDKKAWKEAIEEDTLSWDQVCDFSGWEMGTVKQFAIHALPANLLITPSGKIEGKNLTREEIEKKLKEIAERDSKSKR